MNHDLDEEFKNSKRYRDAGAEVMTTEQYQEAKQEIHWDVAWQIFDEVNQDLDTVKHIDLNCLSHDDALAITKQKVYDTAQIALKSPGRDFIMHVQCGDNHLLMKRDK